MPYYNVQGQFIGHVLDRNGEQVAKRNGVVNLNVIAGSPEIAADMALWDVAYKEYACDDYEWRGEPEVTELPEDQAMAAMGAPMLPGMEA